MRVRVAALSLVETVVAASLLGLIFVFLVGLLPSTGLMVRRAEHQVQAQELVGGLLAQAEATSFTELKLWPGRLDAERPGPFGELLEPLALPDGTLLTPHLVLTPLPPEERVLALLATVEWESVGKQHRHTVLRRLSGVLR